MLPQYQYIHYYDEECDCCNDAMVTLDERTEEGGECCGKKCGRKIMCQDCRECKECLECDWTVCDDCVVFCPKCAALGVDVDNPRFCGEYCLQEHLKTCTSCKDCDEDQQCQECKWYICDECLVSCDNHCGDATFCKGCFEEHKRKCTGSLD